MKHKAMQKDRFCSMRILFFSLTILFVCASNSYAQSTVNGVVIDATGLPLPGVSVTVKGSATGTTTDLNGQFTLNASKSATLVLSYIGMITQEVKVNSRSMINVTLQEDINSLDEVVVVGYGTQKKIHLTGSISSVSSKELLKSTTSNVSQALVGKLPGLISQQATGAPGADDVSLLVRGHSTYNGGDGPLILVDGVERSMAYINPNEVESVTILKDAASCAVYGMKAAAGVILVTTKRGTEGKTTINYKGSLTLSHATTLPEFMNGTHYMQWYNYARRMDGEKAYFTDEEIAMTTNGDPTDGFENTNWQEPIYRTTLMHQHNLSISGGNEKTRYFLSGGFMKQNGFIKGFELERGNFRSNIDTQVTKDISVSLNVAGKINDYYQPGGDSYENQTTNNVVGVLLYAAPVVPLEYEGMPASGYRGASNPDYAAGHSGYSKIRTMRLETSAKIEYSFPFLKGLKAGMFVGWDWQDRDSRSFKYSYELMLYKPESKKYVRQYASNLQPTGGMSVGDEKEQQVVLRPSVSYNQKFGLHDVGALFLYEQTERKGNTLTGYRSDFALLDIDELPFGSTIHPTDGNFSSSTRQAYAGYVGRFNYAYNDRYLAEFTFRYDGSYHFKEGNRWGFFPSASLGWVASEEDFFKELFPQVERFKLRASFGILGSDNVDPFLYRKQYAWSKNSTVFGTTPQAVNTLYNKVSYPMENLTWEKCRSINAGFELSAWNGLLGIEFDVFYKYTYDILRSIGGVYPPSLGGHYPSIENSGTFDNRGFEITVKHRNHIGKFNYSLNGNLSFARNKILRMTQADNTKPWQNRLGTSVGTIWGLKSLGLYQTQAEIDAAPLPISEIPRLGDIRYLDYNGDGLISWDDEVKIARPTTPEMMFSLMADANWKEFDLSVQLQGAALCDKLLCGEWNNGARDQTPLTRPFYAGWDNAPYYLVENSWRPDNTNAEYPRLSTVAYANNAQVSDFWKRNGAYVRLKNVTLGYTLPQSWVKKSGISNLRLFASGYNLFTLTEFKYLDPEAANVIQGYYPQQRTFTFGVDITF